MHGIWPEDYPSGTTNQHTSCKRGENPLGPEKDGPFQHFLSREKGFIRNRIQKEWEQEWKTLEKGRNLCRRDPNLGGYALLLCCAG